MHGFGEGVVGGVLAGPEGITTATDGRTGEEFERGVGGWLELVGYVAVPEKGWCEHGALIFGVGICPDHVHVIEVATAWD